MRSKHTDYWGAQISLSEWLEAIGHKNSAAMREEDNEKRERLKVLNEIINLPYDKPYQFPATKVSAKDPEFAQFLEDHGNELCAIRLMPNDITLPKLRMRGHSIKEAVSWYKDQAIDPALYRVDFVPHAEDDAWATIFVINELGVFGEIIYGKPNQLTQGVFLEEPSISFSYDFINWNFSRNDAAAQKHVEEIVDWLHVNNTEKRVVLTERLETTFSHNHIMGYFETTQSLSRGLWFIDYNRILGKLYKEVQGTLDPITDSLIKGRSGNPGKSIGSIRIIRAEDISRSKLSQSEILVCAMTTPDYIPLMQQASAIVTDLGGILCHAAIVARELGKPCIVGTGNATKILTDGMKVEVDGTSGVVSIL